MRLHEGAFSSWQYEGIKISYIQPEVKRTYTPDFIKVLNGITYYVEAKGRFRTMDEAKKYINIKKALKDNERLVFILMNRTVKMPGRARKKRNGTRCNRQLVTEWLDKNGFEYFFEKDL